MAVRVLRSGGSDARTRARYGHRAERVGEASNPGPGAEGTGGARPTVLQQLLGMMQFSFDSRPCVSFKAPPFCHVITMRLHALQVDARPHQDRDDLLELGTGENQESFLNG